MINLRRAEYKEIKHYHPWPNFNTGCHLILIDSNKKKKFLTKLKKKNNIKFTSVTDAEYAVDSAKAFHIHKNTITYCGACNKINNKCDCYDTIPCVIKISELKI